MKTAILYFRETHSHMELEKGKNRCTISDGSFGAKRAFT